MYALDDDCQFAIFELLNTEEKLLVRGVCQEWRRLLEYMLSNQTILSTSLPHSVRKGLFWYPCPGDGHKRTPWNTINGTWKASDLCKLVSNYFHGVKALFVYNVEFCSTSDLVKFVKMLRGLDSLEHLEVAYCKYSSPLTFSMSLVDVTELGLSLKLSHFTAIWNFVDDRRENLLNFLMAALKTSATLTAISVDTRMALANSDDLLALIKANPVDHFQIVEGVVDLHVRRQFPRVSDTVAICNFLTAIIGIDKITRLIELTRETEHVSNSSVKELTTSGSELVSDFTGLTRLNWINEVEAGRVGIGDLQSFSFSGPNDAEEGELHLWSSFMSPEVWPNLISFRVGLIEITDERLNCVCGKLSNLKELAIGALDGIVEDVEASFVMDTNKTIDSELVKISKLRKLTHLELNFTGITDITLILLLDALKNLKTISLIGCYRLRALDEIFSGRNLKVIRNSDLLKNVQLMTKVEATKVRRREHFQLEPQPWFFDQIKCDERIAYEFAKMTSDPPPHWSMDNDSNEQLFWKVTLDGPKESCYSGMIFPVTIKLHKMYPNVPPELVFKSDILHPNIVRNKSVELELLEDGNWTSSVTTEMVLNAISDLVINPSLAMDKVLNHEAAHLFENNKAKFIQKSVQLLKMTL